MFKIAKLFTIIAVALALLPIENVNAITRVAKTVRFLEFYAGISSPVGSRNGFPGDGSAFPTSEKVNSSDIYDNSFHFGISYGQIYRSNLLGSIGFRFTKHEFLDTIKISDTLSLILIGDPSLSQFDLDFSINYLILDFDNSSFVPYVGAGIQAGILVISEKGFESRRETMLGLSVNFGADLKLSSAKNGTPMWTLVSINSYNLYGFNEKPNYLNIGLGLRYYFRP